MRVVEGVIVATAEAVAVIAADAVVAEEDGAAGKTFESQLAENCRPQRDVYPELRLGSRAMFRRSRFALMRHNPPM
jgi:hypothetical protein